MKKDRFSFDNIKKTLAVTTKSNKVEFLLRNFFWIVFDLFSFYVSALWVILFVVFDFDAKLFLLISVPLLALNLYSIYVMFIKFYSFKINEFTFKTDKVNAPVRLVFVSDVHAGTAFYATNKFRLKKLIAQINKIDKDLVLLGGDFLTYKINKNLLEIFSELQGQKIAVYGNHDSDYRRQSGEPIQYDFPKEFLNACENTGIKFLLNESEIYNINGNSLVIGGLSDLFDLNFDLDKTFENKPSEHFRILLSHNPDIWEFITYEDGIDLVLSGHLHSGQIHSKFTGPVLPMPSKYRHHTKGLYKLNPKTSLLISQGAGYSATRFKIGVENEIMVINLSPIHP